VWDWNYLSFEEQPVVVQPSVEQVQPIKQSIVAATPLYQHTDRLKQLMNSPLLTKKLTISA
jgi:hypothetical protein